jgi:hypothetical protein
LIEQTEHVPALFAINLVYVSTVAVIPISGGAVWVAWYLGTPECGCEGYGKGEVVQVLEIIPAPSGHLTSVFQSPQSRHYTYSYPESYWNETSRFQTLRNRPVLHEDSLCSPSLFVYLFVVYLTTHFQ